MNDSFFKVLDSEEERSFRQWARDNFDINKEADPCWHPCVIDEWAKIARNKDFMDDLEEYDTELELLALRKPDPKHRKCFLWLVVNGQHIGKWTGFFGVTNMADTEDCKGILKFTHENTPESEILEYTLTQKVDCDTEE